MKNLLLYIFLLSSLSSFSQDTISVYFDVNKTIIKPSFKTLLDSIPIWYINEDIDSVRYIGMADSVGNLEDNLVLSKERAQEIKEYCQDFFSKKTPYSILALGENNKNSLNASRRVDIVIYYGGFEENDAPIKCEKFADNSSCFKIEYNIVNNCQLTEIKKGRRTYLQLESDLPDSLFNKKHYSGSLINEEFYYRRVKWKLKNTGKLWWKKQRRVTLILKEDFEKFKLFTLIKDSNCVGCNENLTENLAITNETTCKKVEYNVMINSQYRFNFFKPNSVKVRTPREYIDLSKTYFESCNEEKIIEWNTKNGFRRNNYYYAKIGVRFNYVSNISSLQPCCDTSKLFDCSIPIIGTMNCKMDLKNLMGFRLKTGIWHQKNSRSTYLGASYLYATENSIIELTGAYLFDNKAFSSLSYDYHFLTFPGNPLRAISWSSSQSRPSYSSYFSLYAGSEIQAIFGPKNNPILSQDIHLGLSFQTFYDELFAPKLFFQYGFGNSTMNQYFDVSNRITFGVSFLLF